MAVAMTDLVSVPPVKAYWTLEMVAPLCDCEGNSVIFEAVIISSRYIFTSISIEFR